MKKLIIAANLGRIRVLKYREAGLNPEDVDYVNAHGTSTPAGDEIEVRAVARVLGNAAATSHLSSTKSAIGHLLGAAGAVVRIIRAAKSRRKSSRQRFTLFAPGWTPSAAAGSGSSIHQCGCVADGRRVRASGGGTAVNFPDCPSSAGKSLRIA